MDAILLSERWRKFVHLFYLRQQYEYLQFCLTYGYIKYPLVTYPRALSMLQSGKGTDTRRPSRFGYYSDNLTTIQ
jgi:hypothetical protein